MSTITHIPNLGAGAGWRPQIGGALAQVEALGFIEVIAESIASGALPQGVVAARARGLQVVPHGLGLSLGGAERPQRARLEHLASLAAGVDAPLVSEHIAFVRAAGREAGHLLPVPRTREALEILCENVSLAQEALPVPLALEHVAALVQWPGAEMDEATFVGELIERTGALLLLDVSNLYANAFNHGYDALEALERFPLDRIAYVHVGGGVVRDGIYHDTHAHAVVPGVLHLLEELCAIAEPPGVMLERDDDFPPPGDLVAELGAIAGAVRRGHDRRVCA